MTDPTGNLAELLNDVSGENGKGINAFSSLIGTLADASGAVASIIAIVNFFGGEPDPLQPILDALQQDFAELYARLNARWSEEDWRALANEISAAESVLEILGDLVAAQPPLTEEQRLSYIATCLVPLNALSDASTHPPSPFFLAVYSAQVYWTDSYYGNQAPPAPPDDQVFSYLYVLPYYLKALFIFVAVGKAFFANFGNTVQHQQVVTFTNFLTTVHDMIAGGITKLFSGFPGKPLEPGTSTLFEYGAVEKFSGFSSIKSSEWPIHILTPVPTVQKLQVRALREMKTVYAGVGLPGVWAAINSLNRLTGQNPLPPHAYARWSFRQALSVSGSRPESDGAFHLSIFANFIRHTIPLDTAMTGPFSWRNLLHIGTG
jgi:hypothetical protein